MNLKVILFSSFLFVVGISCKSHPKSTVPKPTQDTARIYIQGAIRDKQTKEPIPFVTYLLFPSDTGSVWLGSVRRGISDQFGNYKIDITTLVDSTTTLVIRCKYIQYALTQIVIKGKVKRSVAVDIEVVSGNGEFYTYYIVEPKGSTLKLEKEINKVSGGGY